MRPGRLCAYIQWAQKMEVVIAMALTTAQVNLLKDSFRVLQEDPEAKSIRFYEELFRLDPELRPMFRDDIAGQGMKFMSTLGVIVESLNTPGALDEQFNDLGQGHRALGVRKGHFKTMEKALIATLKNYLGDKFSPEAEAAWAQAFEEIAAAIIERGHIAV